MRTSEAINELATALAEATAEFGAVVKDGKNPHLKTRYATLAASIDATTPALARHGLTVLGSITGDSPPVHVARLVHRSGQWMEAECPVLTTTEGRQPPMQMLGSAITYARRYCLMALLNLAPVDEDDDGESQRPQHRRETPRRTVTPHPQEHPAVPDETQHKPRATADQFMAFLRSVDLDPADINGYREAHGKDMLGPASSPFHLGAVLERLKAGEVKAIKAWLVQQAEAE